MKATIDIPDDLYRSVKSRTSLEGTTVREVAISLFSAWMDAPPEPVRAVAAVREDPPEWFGLAHAYARNAPRHDMASVRKSIENARRQDETKS
jgi:hypothetical protein